MATRLDRPFPEAPPAQAPELLGRLLLALTFVALAYGLTAPRLSDATGGARLEAVVLLRVFLFALGGLAASLIQGARARDAALGASAALALAALWYLGPPHPEAAPVVNEPDARWAWSGSVRDLLLVQAALLAAVLSGTWLGRLLERPGHLLAVVLCAAAGDAWLNVLHVPESVGPGNPVRLMRFSWPPPLSGLHAAPTFADIFFLALYLEAARRFRFRLLAVAAGAVTAYAVASLLSLIAMKTMLSLPLVGLGVLMGAWPQFRCSAGDVIRAFALALLLFAVLLGFNSLRDAFHPRTEPPPHPFYWRRVASYSGGSGRDAEPKDCLRSYRSV